MTLPVARQVAFDEVPIIDLAALRGGDAAALEGLARRVRQACEEVGFLYIRDHGVPATAREAIWQASRRFFALPVAEKRAVELARSAHFRGYQPLGARGADPGIARSYYEAFQASLELPPDDPDIGAGKPLHGANQWPPALPELRGAVLDWYGRMRGLAMALLELFARGLDLPPDHFAGFYRKPLMQVRLLHYPPQDPVGPGDRLGIREHCDGGGFTILLQDDTGGLEVKNRAGEWIMMPPVADSFVVNIGEMMRTWTNHRFASTPHRVVNRYGRDRYSVAFFVNPDFDATIAPLATCIDAEHPPAFAPFRAGEHLHGIYRSIWPTAPASAEAQG